MLEDLEAPLEVPYLQAVPGAVGRKRLGAYRFGARQSLDAKHHHPGQRRSCPSPLWSRLRTRGRAPHV